MNRSSMPQSFLSDTNPEMATEISGKPLFAALAQQVEHERDMQAMKWWYVYNLSGQVTGQQTLPFILTIEQGTDFKSLFMTASAYSYDADAPDATSFPMPNALGLTNWAGRGLSMAIVDTRSGTTHTSGFVPFELIGTPGYGNNFQNPYPFKNFWYRNTKIRFDIRNRDNANRTHYFEIALHGYKVVTPN